MQNINTTSLLPILFIAFLLSACDEDNSASRVTIGTSGNVLSLNDLQYQLPFVVQVTDDKGLPKQGITIDLRIEPINYFKGTYGVTSSMNSDGDTSLRLDFIVNATCANEDTNKNGILDSGEDINGNGALDPSSISSISAHPTEIPTLTTLSNTLVTDSTGFAYFALTYPKSEAFWSTAQLTATASDGPPGNVQSVNVSHPYSDTSFSNLPSNVEFTGPYGSSTDCADPS